MRDLVHADLRPQTADGPPGGIAGGILALFDGPCRFHDASVSLRRAAHRARERDDVARNRCRIVGRKTAWSLPAPKPAPAAHALFGRPG